MSSVSQPGLLIVDTVGTPICDPGQEARPLQLDQVHILCDDQLFLFSCNSDRIDLSLKDRRSPRGDDHFANSFLISVGQQPLRLPADFSGLQSGQT